VDHYAGDRRPELERQLDERIARIRARTDDGDGDAGGERS
jgi:nucleolar protein 56